MNANANANVAVSTGASERAQRQLFRALRYHTLQDPQLHNTLRDLLTAVKTGNKGLSTAARIYLARRESARPGPNLKLLVLTPRGP